MRATHKLLEMHLSNLLNDMAILAGERVGPSDSSWQDVAGTASVSARVLSDMLMAARHGNHEQFIVFPSPAECIEKGTN